MQRNIYLHFIEIDETFFMQMKHLIIFALAGMVILLGFNMISGSQREKNREVIAASNEVEKTATNAAESNDANASTVNPTTNTSDIASKPLGQQPKAILDKATTQIEQAEQVNQQRVEQITDAQ